VSENKLVLGFKLDGDHPKCWMNSNFRHPISADSLVCVPAKSITHHTAILAMSGSGKSFFLGRLIEEIITQTKCRCVVFDPNADFRRANETDLDIWKGPKYTPDGPSIPLPHEVDGEEFASLWGNSRKRVLQYKEREDDPEFPFEDLTLQLSDISGDFLAADLPSHLRSEVAYAHDFLIEVERHLNPNGDRWKLLNIGERLFRLAQKITQLDFETLAQNELKSIEHDRVDYLYNAPRYVSETGERAYFGAIRRLITQRLIQNKRNESQFTPQPHRLEIIDLPSIPTHEDQLLASHALLRSEWRRAREEWSSAITGSRENDTRVPTFLVIDEAHNLAPKKPLTRSGEILLDQVRTIVAEGRKFGLFVVLVSQRPDKLDELVLSECENVALMKLSNPGTLDDARKLLNLDIDENIRQQILTLKKGRARIFGKWSKEERGEALYCAARRTVQGGADLKQEHWATTSRPDE
jgi:Helicase HerA, central domain